MGNFDLVIAGSGFEEFSSDVNIMYLSDLCGNQAAEEAMWEKDTIPQKKIVTKYQPMEQFLHLMTFRRNYPDHLPMCRNLHSHRFPFGHPCLHINFM